MGSFLVRTCGADSQGSPRPPLPPASLEKDRRSPSALVVPSCLGVPDEICSRPRLRKAADKAAASKGGTDGRRGGAQERSDGAVPARDDGGFIPQSRPTAVWLGLQRSQFSTKRVGRPWASKAREGRFAPGARSCSFSSQPPPPPWAPVAQQLQTTAFCAQSRAAAGKVRARRRAAPQRGRRGSVTKHAGRRCGFPTAVHCPSRGQWGAEGRDARSSQAATEGAQVSLYEIALRPSCATLGWVPHLYAQ